MDQVLGNGMTPDILSSWHGEVILPMVVVHTMHWIVHDGRRIVHAAAAVCE
jgi:hypothetical protein